MKSPGNGLVTINGLVTPSGWDEVGNVTALTISTFDEDEYLIEKNGKGDQLHYFIRRKVEVSGVINEVNGVKSIQIRDYRVK